MCISSRDVFETVIFSTVVAFRSEAESFNKLLLQANKSQVIIKELFCQRSEIYSGT
jgi:hypothetical protein